MLVAIVAIVALAALLAYREYLHTNERAELLDRIQAPAMVVQQRAAEHNPLPEPGPVDMGPWSEPPPPEDD